MRCVWLFTLMALTGNFVSAADGIVYERPLPKEPKYQGKPQYLLMAFGPKADQRVWVVRDGSTLYVDRQGNGDLTEASDRVLAQKADNSDGPAQVFEVGELTVGGKVHKACRIVIAPLRSLADNPNVSRLPHVARAIRARPDALSTVINIDVESTTLKGGGLGGRASFLVNMFDADGVLELSEKPGDAPVVHFDGPLQVVVFGSRPTLIAGRTQDLVLAVGTTGSGPGALAMLHYEGTIPAEARPRVDVTFRPKAGEPVRETVELKKRC